MIKYYNWLVCKLFKRCEIHIPPTPKAAVQKRCQKEPWSAECRIYED